MTKINTEYISLRAHGSQYTRDGWLRTLRTRYGEDLRGLSLAQLEQLPDIEWRAGRTQPTPYQKFKRILGRAAIVHPSEPDFSFDHCKNFFDGQSYVRALTATYGEKLEHMPDETWRQMPKIESGEDAGHAALSYPELPTPAEAIDSQRSVHEFLSHS